MILDFRFTLFHIDNGLFCSTFILSIKIVEKQKLSGGSYTNNMHTYNAREIERTSGEPAS